jgi:hypothetical protein
MNIPFSSPISFHAAGGISIRRRVSSAMGAITVNSPFLISAFTLFGSTRFGNRTERNNDPA